MPDYCNVADCYEQTATYVGITKHLPAKGGLLLDVSIVVGVCVKHAHEAPRWL